MKRTEKLFSLFSDPKKYLPDWWTDELTESANTNGATWAELCMRMARGVKKDIWRVYNKKGEALPNRPPKRRIKP